MRIVGVACLVVLLGCNSKPKKSATVANSVAPLQQPVPPQPISVADLDRFAEQFLRAAQSAVLTKGIEANAKENLRRQRTPGGAEIAKIEYRDACQSAAQAKERRDGALSKLVAEEERLAKAGMKWDSALYSAVLLGYEAEATEMRRDYERAAIYGTTGDLHERWLAFLRVTIAQIRDGDY